MNHKAYSTSCIIGQNQHLQLEPELIQYAIYAPENRVACRPVGPMKFEVASENEIYKCNKFNLIDHFSFNWLNQLTIENLECYVGSIKFFYFSITYNIY